jgi:hypothetical protein
MYSIYTEEGHQLALLDTYLAMILGSVGSAQYRRLFVQKPEGAHDVIGDGDLACAYFVSSILTLCGLIRGGVHTTVDMTVHDLLVSGWVEGTVQEGAVLIWAPKLCTDGTCHRHIGFSVGREMAVSNDAARGYPAVHHNTYEESRVIEAVYIHKKISRT